jgi:glycosyltransferase involved in cell wall biosynthesis
MADDVFVDEAIRVLRGCSPLILMGHLTPGGNERQGYLLAKGLSAASMKPGVIVWTLTNDDLYLGLLAESGIPTIAAPQGAGAARKVRWLRQVMLQLRPAVLHAYTFFLNAAAAWAMRNMNGIAIGSMRGEYGFESANGSVYYAVNRRWPRTIIANSVNAQKAALADPGMFRPRRTLVVTNGIDESAYRGRVHGPQARPRVIGVGNLYPGKRWDRLIRAAAELRESDPDLNFSIEIVGEGGERPGLEKLIRALNVSDRVTLLGRRYDVPELLAESDLFALVSDSEGTPNAVMEAMASGLPIVATAAGDIPRLVDDGVHGFVVERSDGKALANRLRRLLVDHCLRSQMGAESRRRSKSEFGLSLLVQNTLAAYRAAGWAG